MNEINVTFDLHNKTCNHVVNTGFYKTIRLSLAFSSENERTYFNNLKFGYTFQKNHTTIKKEDFPKNNFNYESADKSPLVSLDFETEVETEYQFYVWCENAEEKIEKNINFKTGRPQQPFASWSWDGKQWNAPIPEPGDIPRKWNETSQSWVSIIN